MGDEVSRCSARPPRLLKHVLRDMSAALSIDSPQPHRCGTLLYATASNGSPGSTRIELFLNEIEVDTNPSRRLLLHSELYLIADVASRLWSSTLSCSRRPSPPNHHLALHLLWRPTHHHSFPFQRVCRPCARPWFSSTFSPCSASLDRPWPAMCVVRGPTRLPSGCLH